MANKPTKPISAATHSDHDAIYAQLKICLSKITGFPIDQIYSADSLENKYHFNAGGRRALALNLEQCFKGAGMPIPKPLDRDSMQAAQSVLNVLMVVIKAFEA